MKDILGTVAATVAAVLIMGLALLLNPVTIVVMFFINPSVAVGLLILALVCGLLNILTGAITGVLHKWMC